MDLDAQELKIKKPPKHRGRFVFEDSVSEHLFRTSSDYPLKHRSVSCSVAGPLRSLLMRADSIAWIVEPCQLGTLRLLPRETATRVPGRTLFCALRREQLGSLRGFFPRESAMTIFVLAVRGLCGTTVAMCIDIRVNATGPDSK